MFSDSHLNDIDIDVNSAVPCEREIAKILLMTALKVLGPGAPSSISLDQSFFDVGGNSLNSILMVTSLKDIGYDIG